MQATMAEPMWINAQARQLILPISLVTATAATVMTTIVKVVQEPEMELAMPRPYTT